MSRKRKLRPEEQALWDKVAARTERLPGETGKSLPVKKPESADRARSGSAPGPAVDPLPKFQIGQRVDHSADHDLLPGLAQQMRSQPVAMDRKAFGKMKRGKLRPEARIDLHGMTLEQAHPALLSFVLGAQASGKRLVLVITGKGKARDDGGPIPTRFGVLRHQVPQWLRMPPLAGVVLQVTTAHVSHGGDGAYYVYLRRNR